MIDFQAGVGSWQPVRRKWTTLQVKESKSLQREMPGNCGVGCLPSCRQQIQKTNKQEYLLTLIIRFGCLEWVACKFCLSYMTIMYVKSLRTLLWAWYDIQISYLLKYDIFSQEAALSQRVIKHSGSYRWFPFSKAVDNWVHIVIKENQTCISLYWQMPIRKKKLFASSFKLHFYRAPCFFKLYFKCWFWL